MPPPHDQSPPRLAVSPAEAARMAGIGRTRLYESLSSGDLPSFKIGSRRLIRIRDLDAWLSSFEVRESANAG